MPKFIILHSIFSLTKPRTNALKLEECFKKNTSTVTDEWQLDSLITTDDSHLSSHRNPQPLCPLQSAQSQQALIIRRVLVSPDVGTLTVKYRVYLNTLLNQAVHMYVTMPLKIIIFRFLTVTPYPPPICSCLGTIFFVTTFITPGVVPLNWKLWCSLNHNFENMLTL